jgi:hypothetical protein
VGLAALLALCLIPAGATPAAGAAEITFGAPSATAVFGTGVTFSQPVTATGLNARYVEILITRPGLVGTEVHSISQVGAISSTTFEYSLREANQHLFPNTRLTARWRVTDSTGQTQVGPETSVTYADTRFRWQSANGKLVQVHWYKGDDGFGRRALAIAEAGVAKAEELFGVTETRPVDFYVYGDLQAFYGALGPGTRENVGGEALPELRTLFALITPDQIDDSWVGVVIPHELTHLVFDTAVHNPFHFPPRWLNEGLAVYLSQGLDPSDRRLVTDAVNSGEVIPLSGLVGQFPTRRDKFSLAYAESVSALDFLLRTYGRPALVKLIRSYATGISDDAAFTAALGVDTAAFNAAWLADIGARRPMTLGPRPDPAGPLPAGWSSSPAPAQAPAQSQPAQSAAAPSAAAQSTPSQAAASPPSSAASAPAAATPAGSPALPPPSSFAALPTLAAAASAAPPSGAAPTAPQLPAATPGIIGDQPLPARSNVGLAWLLGLLAVLLAAAGVGLLVFRRRSTAPR